MLLLIDNYDSFAHNLARYFVRLGCDVVVVRNDAITVDEVKRLEPEAIVVSPGPRAPEQAGCSIEVIRECHQQTPILGVCLGHQAIVAAWGGRIERTEPQHGRPSLVHHSQTGVFTGLPTPFSACRYHSLGCPREAVPAPLQVIGWTHDNIVMAVAHRKRPVIGLQFHPESILTEHGYEILGNFLRLAGITPITPLPTWEDELQRKLLPLPAGPQRPATF